MFMARVPKEVGGEFTAWGSERWGGTVGLDKFTGPRYKRRNKPRQGGHDFPVFRTEIYLAIMIVSGGTHIGSSRFTTVPISYICSSRKRTAAPSRQSVSWRSKSCT